MEDHEQNSPTFPPPRFSNTYEAWTRRPVIYLPIIRQGVLIGYLWAGMGVEAAGYIRRVSADPDNLTCAEFWEERFLENHRNSLSAEQAIHHWIGYPEDPRCGGVPAGAVVQQANSIQGLWDQLNPEGPPMGPGPLVQDDIFPDGTPTGPDRHWSAPHVANPPTYAGETSTPVHFLEVTKNGEVVGFLWASPTEQAAGYLPLRYAGLEGINGRGLWLIRLSRCFAERRHPVDAIRYCRSFPYDEYSGWIEPDAPEGIAPSLAELREAANE